MIDLMKASVYCGTYRAYNEGSLYGKWMKLSKYGNKSEFYAACRKLHAREYDPEFMFQDWENIPDSMIGESYIKDEVFDVLNILREMPEEKRLAFAEYCEAHGAEQDLAALKEFGKSGKTKPSKLPYGTLLRAEYEKVWNDDRRMVDYCMGKTSTVVKTSLGLVPFDKPRIKTSFCFGYGHDACREYEQASKDCENFGEQGFMRSNLRDFDEKLKRFDEEYRTLYLAPKYDKDSGLYYYCLLTDWKAKEEAYRYPNGLHRATEEDRRALREAVVRERAKFEKRLKSYLKRYGTSKLKKWTYWADA